MLHTPASKSYWNRWVVFFSWFEQKPQDHTKISHLFLLDHILPCNFDIVSVGEKAFRKTLYKSLTHRLLAFCKATGAPLETHTKTLLSVLCRNTPSFPTIFSLYEIIAVLSCHFQMQPQKFVISGTIISYFWCHAAGPPGKPHTTARLLPGGREMAPASPHARLPSRPQHCGRRRPLVPPSGHLAPPPAPGDLRGTPCPRRRVVALEERGRAPRLLTEPARKGGWRSPVRAGPQWNRASFVGQQCAVLNCRNSLKKRNEVWFWRWICSPRARPHKQPPTPFVN